MISLSVLVDKCDAEAKRGSEIDIGRKSRSLGSTARFWTRVVVQFSLTGILVAEGWQRDGSSRLLVRVDKLI